jgi:hypothetical protein
MESRFKSTLQLIDTDGVHNEVYMGNEEAIESLKDKIGMIFSHSMVSISTKLANQHCPFACAQRM